ncbi:major capsid protein [Pseudomonas benzenivorans]|uniref:Bacteriophage coat protein B n=1 Tax=Pseudomonas benzenivorans TaxID=556533 RepID=A0ABY5H9Z1_9PSED|nr:major capsid protein [Pseudomonas benzenivorans]UTW09166.1 hypothetical protein KDW96_07625 [Pseudomonas benzenivorans]
MKTRNMLRKYGRQVAAVAILTTVTASQAFADAAAAATKITGSEGDIGTLGWAAIGLVITAAAFKYMRRAV